ncbi:MAG: hypothetical protein AAFX03_02435 [Pseudomonadota bacterium]
MDRADLLRFYAATRVWLWPVLWWRLWRLDAEMAARRARGETVLAEVITNGYGALRVRWIVRTAAPSRWRPDGPDRAGLADLDAYAEGFAAAAGGAMIPPGRRVPTRRAPIYPPFAHLEPG